MALSVGSIAGDRVTAASSKVGDEWKKIKSVATVQLRIARAIRARQTHAHARLKNTVSFRDQRAVGTPLARAESSAIEWMRQGFHQLPSSVARKLLLPNKRAELTYTLARVPTTRTM